MKPDLLDIAGGIGVALVGIGFGMIYLPWGFIASGVIIMTIVLFSAYRAGGGDGNHNKPGTS